MAFQFLCPQGHLLEAEDSQGGQQCLCPYCGAQFLVPQIGEAPGAQGVGEPPAQTGGQHTFAPVGGQQVIDLGGPQPHSVVHILCPSGHCLETPREMLGQDALCPFCQAQFRLRLENSIEYRRQKADQQELRELRLGQLWLRWSVAIAVAVIVTVIILIAAAVSR